ncbi:14607_t:CDS:2 [Ambispora leptoticha]|uniref:14607_t:CDS:1 n=1 Tax=Ambispora leptoticha TaxID=144679 RepID=A0A9N9F6L6_9GLOM|nr:14607_t:CDS:2 [Ambispora leptoticha]
MLHHKNLTEISLDTLEASEMLLSLSKKPVLIPSTYFPKEKTSGNSLKNPLLIIKPIREETDTVQNVISTSGSLDDNYQVEAAKDSMRIENKISMNTETDNDSTDLVVSPKIENLLNSEATENYYEQKKDNQISIQINRTLPPLILSELSLVKPKLEEYHLKNNNNDCKSQSETLNFPCSDPKCEQCCENPFSMINNGLYNSNLSMPAISTMPSFRSSNYSDSFQLSSPNFKKKSNQKEGKKVYNLMREKSSDKNKNSSEQKRVRRKFKYFADNTSSATTQTTSSSTLSVNSQSTNNAEIPKTRQGEPLRCANCGTRDTPAWRRDLQGVALLCNACGIYLRLHNRHRPFQIDPDGEIHISKDQSRIDCRIKCAKCDYLGATYFKGSLGRPLCQLNITIA